MTNSKPREHFDSEHTGATGPRRGPVSIIAKGDTVVDTVGAGDTFMGALIYGLLEVDLVGAVRRDALRELPLGPLEQIMGIARIRLPSRSPAPAPSRLPSGARGI